MTAPGTYCDTIGKQLQNCELLTVAKSKKINTTVPSANKTDMNRDTCTVTSLH